MSASKKYLIYDSRAIPKEHLSKKAKELIAEDCRMESLLVKDVDDCTIFEICDTLQEARENAKDYGDGNCIYSYDVKGGSELVNERFVEVVL